MFKFLVLISIFALTSVTHAARVTEDICNINVHEGDVCDYEVKNLQAFAGGGTVIKCTKIETSDETKYIVEVPRSVQASIIYDIKVKNAGDFCNITSMTIRP